MAEKVRKSSNILSFCRASSRTNLQGLSGSMRRSPSTSAGRVLVVVAQLVSALKILLSTITVSQQQSGQPAGVGGAAAGGIQFNRHVEVRQRQFRIAIQQVRIATGEMGYRVSGTEFQSHVAVCDRQVIVSLGHMGVRTEPVLKRFCRFEEHRSIVIGDGLIKITLHAICASPTQVGCRVFGVEPQGHIEIPDSSVVLSLVPETISADAVGIGVARIEAERFQPAFSRP